ncbi:hypothetical protein [Rhodovulum sp. MB263]|uniref:hypothetical protein n=1 Tax=unclassified Rhodovulum TaxID=2631432 RepID=UPI0012DB0E04|nr:hypothetical protein [Rhodovulum sp. MB263]
MAKQPHIEQRPWWPDALRRFEQLAAAGEPRSRATTILAEEFDASHSTFRNAIERGTVPAYDPISPERAAAWAAGNERYEGAPCKKHETRTRYTNDGYCVTCMAEHLRRSREKRRDKIASRGAE